MQEASQPNLGVSVGYGVQFARVFAAVLGLSIFGLSFVVTGGVMAMHPLEKISVLFETATSQITNHTQYTNEATVAQHGSPNQKESIFKHLATFPSRYDAFTT